jgi:CHAD domain-containing protein
MAFKFKASGSMGKNARRIVGREIAKAIETLQPGQDMDTVEAIHEARGHVKRARSALSLLRAAFPKPVRGEIDQELRDANHRLAPARDAHILRASWEGLVAHRRCGKDVGFEEQVRQLLLEHERSADVFASGQLDVLDQVNVGLEQALNSIDDATLSREKWRDMWNALRKSYRRGCGAYRVARRERSSESLHAWRRRLTELREQLRLFRPAAPRLVGSLVKSVHQLTDRVGDEHDLWILQEFLRESALIPGDVAAREPFIALIDERRAALGERALAEGSRLYDMSAERLARAISRAWSHWRKG